MPRSTICNLEIRKQLGTRVENLVGLARAFGLTLDELLAGGRKSRSRKAA